ncbi:MAG: CpsD/CapB family tyrosine-protein kinase [Firmicutes bacterium]|nr:CpsD/CapB family tyrosine-protein kinase [Bacillota bacterium]
MQNVAIRTIEQLDFRTKEAYKTLRTNLSFAGKDVKVISLTSCTPNEGKSSVSFQLCMSLAESGKKTILVDADMRRSVLRSRYKANKGKFGLSHYLSGQAEYDDVCCRTNVENFDMIFAGPVPPNPSELLSGDSFKSLLELLRWKYDYVIVDTPPLGSVIDGAVAAACCDGAVIVIESGAVSYKLVQNIKDQLDKVNCRVLGCVLNKVNLKKSGHYSKYYDRYYSYYGSSGEEEEVLQMPEKKDGVETGETASFAAEADAAAADKMKAAEEEK